MPELLLGASTHAVSSLKRVVSVSGDDISFEALASGGVVSREQGDDPLPPFGSGCLRRFLERFISQIEVDLSNIHIHLGREVWSLEAGNTPPTCEVGSSGADPVSFETIEQLSKVSDAGFNIGRGIEAVAYTKVPRCCWHELH